MSLPARSLGSSGMQVSALGLGCMSMSGLYGPAEDPESIATIQAAVDAGITYFDTGDFYGMGHNETLLGRALAGRRGQVQIGVKFGALRGPDGDWLGLDVRPNAVKNFLTYTLQRLGTDYVDLYYPARVDRSVPIEDTIGAIVEMKEKGYVRHIGISEAGPETLERAHKVHPLSMLQIEYSLFSRGIERAILPLTRKLGIGITAYAVLSRGLLGSRPLESADMVGFRAHLPRFQGENLERNQRLREAVAAIAARKGCTVPQLAFAWVLAQGPDIVPLIGTKTRARLAETLGAAAVELSGADLRALREAVPEDAVSGTRYMAGQMTWLDSELPQA